MTHTPLKVVEGYTYDFLWDGKDQVLCTFSRDRKQVFQEIVQVCNAHPVLVAALKEASDAIYETGNIVEATGNAGWEDLPQRIEAALKLAEDSIETVGSSYGRWAKARGESNANHP